MRRPTTCAPAGLPILTAHTRALSCSPASPAQAPQTHWACVPGQQAHAELAHAPSARPACSPPAHQSRDTRRHSARPRIMSEAPLLKRGSRVRRRGHGHQSASWWCSPCVSQAPRKRLASGAAPCKRMLSLRLLCRRPGSCRHGSRGSLPQRCSRHRHRLGQVELVEILALQILPSHRPSQAPDSAYLARACSASGSCAAGPEAAAAATAAAPRSASCSAGRASLGPLVQSTAGPPALARHRQRGAATAGLQCGGKG